MELVAAESNNAGQVVGGYVDGTGTNHGFLDSGSTFATVDYPSASGTAPRAINNNGQIVGAYNDASGVHGFLALPAPIYHLCLLYDSTKAVHSGSTIPIKLQLCDGSGNDLSSWTIILHATSITQVSTSTSGQVQSPGDANPDSNFRFDSTLGTTGGYIFNFKTTGLSTGTYNLNFTVTGDSFVYAAPFQVR